MAHISSSDAWAFDYSSAPACPFPPVGYAGALARPSRPAEDAAQPDSVVIALVGLAFEARIASGPGVAVICRNSERGLTASLEEALRQGCRSIISFGVAGGLAPHLRPGQWVVASSVVDAKDARATDLAWSEKIRAVIPCAEHKPIIGVDYAVADPAEKRRMHAETGAVTVDMESHLVARVAAAHGLNFAAVRVVIDPAHRPIPGAALAGMRPDGSTSISSVLRELAGSPSQISGLLRLACDGYKARRALQRVRRVLGPDFARIVPAQA